MPASGLIVNKRGRPGRPVVSPSGEIYPSQHAAATAAGLSPSWFSLQMRLGMSDWRPATRKEIEAASAPPSAAE